MLRRESVSVGTMSNQGHFNNLKWTKIQTRISPFVIQTPVITNKALNNLYGLDVFFKCENLQNTGAFKVRGAANMVMKGKVLCKISREQQGFVTLNALTFHCSKIPTKFFF